MELVLRHPDDAPIERKNDLVVIVACEDATTAPRACSLLERVGHNVGGEGRLIFSWWTFAVLASPALRHLASSEAASADMIVVAAREMQGVPDVVKKWLTLWLTNGEDQPRPRALVTLLEADPNRNATAKRSLLELKLLAESAAVDFFADGDEVGQNMALTRGAVPPSGNSPCRASRRGDRVAGRSCWVPGRAEAVHRNMNIQGEKGKDGKINQTTTDS